jgi:membrane associated rhomboid family serine protease/Flp pilus assembly protein TadD
MEEPNEIAEEKRGTTVEELLDRITPRVWVTPAVAILIVIGFGIELALGVSFGSPTGAQLLAAGADYGPYFVDGGWWRTVTAMFLHSGPLHLAFNLWAFWSAGRLTERIYGNTCFLAIYFLSGVGASLVSLAWSPLTASVGASGAVFGVYGALLAFMLLHRGVLPPEYLARQRNSIVGFIGYNVVFGLSQKNTDMAAHAGGFVAGALAGSVLARDLLRPGEQVARRAFIAAGLALLLVAGGFVVRRRTLEVPFIKAGRLGETAGAHLDAKRYREAIAGYTDALTYDRDEAWLFNRGLAYLGVDEMKLAQQDILDAHVFKPTVKTHSLLCEIGSRIGGPANVVEETIAHCNAALALDAQARSVRAQRAALNLQRKKADEAEQDCAVLLAEPEPREYALYVCARVAHERKDAPAERARLDRSLALAPADESALGARASLNGEEGRLAESVADYSALLGIAPGESWAWNNRAWAEVEMGDFAAARADADRAVALAPDESSSRGTRCFALVGLGELAAARDDCVRALELRPDVASDLGMLAFVDKRYGDARREWEDASRGSPAQARALRPWLAKLPPR